MIISELEKIPLRLQVARELRRLLRSGYYAPGSRVTEKSVSDSLNVSKTPAREALSLLGEKNVLRSLPNGGFAVPLLTAKEVDEIYQARAFLEVPALRIAIENRDERTYKDLREAVMHLSKASSGGELSSFIEAFLAFRETLFKGCDNEFLMSLIQRIDNQTEAMKAQVFADPAMREESIAQYDRLCIAFCEGDMEKAELVLCDHHRMGRSTYRTTAEAFIGAMSGAR